MIIIIIFFFFFLNNPLRKVGHSIDSDLRALKLVHRRVIDTAALYPHPKGAPLKQSLKALAKEVCRIE